MKKNKTGKQKGKLTPNAMLNEVGGAVRKKSIKEIEAIIQAVINRHNYIYEDKLTMNNVMAYFQYKFKRCEM